jgi:hypothetical protein
LFLGAEAAGGFEVKLEGFVGASLVLVEDERICADGEGEGEAAEYVEGGLAVAGFVAAELGDVDTDAFGQYGLGEAAFFAEGGEAVGEVHVGEGDDLCAHCMDAS